MTYTVEWGSGEQRDVATVEELDALLDEISATGAPEYVTIYPPGHEDDPDASPWDTPPGDALEIGVGHPERAFVRWHADGTLATQTDVPPWPDGAPDIEFNYGGEPVFCGPDRARVTPATAREAAREYVRTGRRPTGLTWKEQD